MAISKRVAWFLIAFGVWSWIIWPTFLKNIWADDRSWNHGMTAFFGVHLVLTVVSLALGTIIGLLGIRGLRGSVEARSANSRSYVGDGATQEQSDDAEAARTDLSDAMPDLAERADGRTRSTESGSAVGS